jgi:release factor glutamine methyltransferase
VTTTVGDLLRELDGVVPAPEARWLVEAAVGVPPIGPVLTEEVTERMVRHLEVMVGRLRSGEPLQYVLGHWSFRHLDLAVDHRVLIPRPETEQVAGLAIEIASRVPGPRRVADLGTGSGAIGLSMAVELPLDDTEVWITDVDPDALEVARANLAGIGRAARNVRVALGSWAEALPAGMAFDVIVSNPPYVAEGSPHLEPIVAAHEPARALLAGPDGLSALRRIAETVPSRLRPGGTLVLEIGFDQGQAVRSLLDGGGLVGIEVVRDASGHDRIVVARTSAT